MKLKCIKTMLIGSNEGQVHSNKANWFKESLLNQMKTKCIQTKLIDSNKAYWIKWKASAFKQS